MKSLRKGTLWLWLLLPLAAWAGARQDYASQWPLQLHDAQAGAYRVVLDDAVYRQLQSPALKDLDVIDAKGQPVPAALFDPQQSIAQPLQGIELPWFPLPQAGASSTDIAAISEIASDGSLRRVEWRAGEGGGREGAGNAFLIDASRLSSPPAALRVEWDSGQAPFDLAFRVEASDDLKDWRTLQDEAHLVDLQNAGQRVLRDRIPLERGKARYLRLLPLQRGQAPLRLGSVRAELQSATDVDWHWQTLDARRVQDKDGRIRYEFELPGRFPVERADVELPGNSTRNWTLESRDDAEAPWRAAATPWVAFRLQAGTQVESSAPQPLHGIARDRHWRLTPAQAQGDSLPRLRLGYRPEVLVFVAQGDAPFRLVAGSTRAARVDAPLPQLVDAIRAQRGPQWQPAAATLGTSQALAGEAALAPPPRDWKTWLLWGLLVAGALLVAGFAFSLMRKPAP